MAAVWGWILWVTGVTDPYWNNWWGGFFGDISYFGIFVVVWKRLECHAPGCHRIGLHRTADGTYMLCRKHHPDVPNKLRLEDIHAAHFAAKRTAERTLAAVIGPTAAGQAVPPTDRFDAAGRDDVAAGNGDRAGRAGVAGDGDTAGAAAPAAAGISPSTASSVPAPRHAEE